MLSANQEWMRIQVLLLLLKITHNWTLWLDYRYDFFAPLGEFGQPRQHYHQMRRLHLLLQ